MIGGTLRAMPIVSPRVSVVSLLDGLPWPTILLNDAGKVTHVNGRMRARGVSLDGTADRRLLALFPEYFNALQGERRWLVSQDVDVVTPSADGPAHERLHLRKLEAGALLVVVDQTRLHELEAGYAQNARLASMGFLLASISHEISSPLSVISSSVQILQSKRGVSGEVRKKGIALMGDSARRMLLIARRLTNFSRVGEGVRGEFAIDDAIDEASLQLRCDSLGESVEFRHQREPEALVLGHEPQLQQVFFNLFLNAAQAMKGRGSIIVETRRATGNQVLVTITDTGPGIDADAIDRIFEPFFTTKPQGEGLGLGLAISSEIVAEHGGKLTASAAAPGMGGAVFHLQLPLAPPGRKGKS
jgi:signal transduction histidine kinase